MNRSTPETGFDLWAMPSSGDRRPVPFVQTRFNEGNAAFAPDGKWVAYVSDKSGQNEVYVRPFAKPGELKPLPWGNVVGEPKPVLPRLS